MNVNEVFYLTIHGDVCRADVTTPAGIHQFKVKDYAKLAIPLYRKILSWKKKEISNE